MESYYKVQSDKLTSHLRIVQLSDLHLREFGENNCDLVARIRALKPDIIAITGDMNDKKSDDTHVVTDLCAQLVEIAHADAGKANGIRFLAKRCGISLEQVMACGNADNDAEMLRDAGMGVAVANAMESCLAAADDITDSNDEDGVAKAVERFVLSEEKYF